MAEEKKPIRITKKMIQLVEVILKNGTDEQKKPILEAIESYKETISKRKKELKALIKKSQNELDALNGKVSDEDETKEDETTEK